MKQIIKHCKIKFIILFCISCLLLGLSVAKLTVSAKDEYPYYIKVNKQQNCVTIYEKDKNGKYTKPIKAMTCSTGPATPVGVYHTLVKYRWKLLMGDVWGQYSTRIVNGVLFHSVWYYDMDESTLSAKQYNKLGTSASHGCVRLTVADAKWIFDHCAVGTTVEIYKDKDPGPLGKPETLLLEEGTGWDPTDPSKDNPYNDNKPSIKGATNQSIVWGTKTNLLKGVKATSTAGTDITSKLTVKGKLDIYDSGKYNITYSVTDAIGRTAKKTITFTVKECKEKPKFKGITDQVVNSDTTIDRNFALNGVKAYLVNKALNKDDIKVKIEKDSEDSYMIKYSIKGENNLTGTATATVFVDTTKIQGVTNHIHIPYGTELTQEYVMQGITASNSEGDCTENITTEVKNISDNEYVVTYSILDEEGFTISVDSYFMVDNDLTVEENSVEDFGTGT